MDNKTEAATHIAENSVFTLRSNLLIHPLPDQQDRFLLEDPQSGRVFTFKKREFTIITLLDGSSPLSVVIQNVQRETGASLTLATAAKFIARLGQLDLLEQGQEASQMQPGKRAFWEIKLERWSSFLRLLARLFFSPFPGLLLFGLALLVFLAEAFFWHTLYARSMQRFFSWPAIILTFIILYACLPFIMFIHELGHALAAGAFLGRFYPIRIYRFHKAQVSLPAAAIWRLRSRGARVVIALAGLYFQGLLLLFLGAIWGWLGQQPMVGLLCTACSIPLIGSFLLSMIPAMPGLLEMKTDGYFALSYLLNIPNLVARAQSYQKQKRRSVSQPLNWMMQLTRFQRAGFMSYLFVLPWLGLVLILGVFCCASLQIFLPIPTTGLVVIAIIACWLVWPYLIKLRVRFAG